MEFFIIFFLEWVYFEVLSLYKIFLDCNFINLMLFFRVFLLLVGLIGLNFLIIKKKYKLLLFNNFCFRGV